jgi:murein DD-endopeptidase MepM/ murein hydrolase activator NlpD
MVLVKRPILQRPVDKRFSISQDFWVLHPGDKFFEWAYRLFDGHHPGVDFGLPEGKTIYNAFDGVVVRKEFHEGMGNVVGIRNGNTVAIYAHMSEVKISLGQILPSGVLIGLSGNTGKATKPDFPHLHFELRDIAQPTLLEMVFKPEFGLPIEQWSNTFSYKVNNESTVKNWRLLSLRYFGDENKWEVIRKNNSQLAKLNEVDQLPQGFEILIPNFD